MFRAIYPNSPADFMTFISPNERVNGGGVLSEIKKGLLNFTSGFI